MDAFEVPETEVKRKMTALLGIRDADTRPLASDLAKLNCAMTGLSARLDASSPGRSLAELRSSERLFSIESELGRSGPALGGGGMDARFLLARMRPSLLERTLGGGPLAELLTAPKASGPAIMGYQPDWDRIRKDLIPPCCRVARRCSCAD
jgi:hypothetical protein